jgi:hypothetical protein
MFQNTIASRINKNPRGRLCERVVAIGCGAACIVSFLVVQKWIDHTRLLENGNYRAAVTEFEHAVARGADLDAAASAVGFRPELYIRIFVDSMKRLANGQVEIRGWAAYMPGDQTPLILFVLAGNTTVLELTTEGERKDAARAFKLNDAAAYIQRRVAMQHRRTPPGGRDHERKNYFAPLVVCP